MIRVLCSGGLGNQMFQYAFFRRLQLNNEDVILDTSFFVHNTVHSGYELNKCFGFSDNVVTHNFFNHFWRGIYFVMSKLNVGKFMNIIIEKQGEKLDLSHLTGREIMYGYWQTEEYFSDYKELIIKELSFINLSNKSINISKQMASENSVAIHVRRGDYLLASQYVNLGNTNYYHNAIDYIKENVNNPKYYVFSDDINWCKKNLDIPKDSMFVDFNTGNRSYEDMFLISCCKYAVVANSSFSWWGGYLGNHDFVLRPEKYKVKWDEKQDSFLYPKEWVKIEV